MSPTRQQPHAPHAECQVISAAVLDREALSLVGDVLNPDGSDFYVAHHADIWAAIVAVSRAGATPDASAVSAQLKTAGAPEGAQAALLEATAELPLLADVEVYARKVRNRAAMRAAAAAAQSLLAELYSGVDDEEAWLDGAEHALSDAVAHRSEGGQLVSAPDAVQECWEALQARCGAGGGPEGHECGLKLLDDALSGWCSGKLYIIGGRPGMGKSMLAKDIAVGIARQGLPVAVFSLEMPRREWMDRVVCGEAGVGYETWRDARLDRRDVNRVMEASNTVSQWPLHIADKAGVSVEYVARWARRLKRRSGSIGAVVIDYMQLMRSQKRIDSREQEIAHMSRSLKELAKELGCPVIALSQLNRAVEARQDKRPMLSDLRESGSIEQDADAVLFCYRDEYYNPESPNKGVVEVNIAKQRGGRTGPVQLAWQGDRARVANLHPGTF